MIIQMPFTYLSDELIHQIYTGLGPFGLCQLGDTFQPDHLANWIQRRIIHVHTYKGVVEAQLSKTLKAFQEWGLMHGAHLGDMAGYYAAGRKKSPLTDDTNPTKISHLIRQYGNKTDEMVPDPQFQAALFLAMAQAHDEQQASVDGSMSLIEKMERDMMAKLSGELPDGRDISSPVIDPDAGVNAPGLFSKPDPGQSYTNERIEAWAKMALRLDDAADLYFTISDAVFSAMLERLSNAVPLGRWRLPLKAVEGSDADAEGDISPIFHDLATAKDPIAASAAAGQDEVPATDAAAVNSIEFYSITGKRPWAVLGELSHTEPGDPWPQSTVRNTIIGRLFLAENI